MKSGFIMAGYTAAIDHWLLAESEILVNPTKKEIT
jgi:hypothetical protein